jgi:glycosyltransferase involved in cell wall biosynthesis
MKEKIAYIGPSYHQKTKSTVFLIEYLKSFFDVEVFTDNDWLKSDIICKNDAEKIYKAVVFFQMLPSIKDYKKIKHLNLIFFPMYDQSSKLKCTDWVKYRGMKIINFSKTLHKRLSKWGFNSSYVQFFPEPKSFEPGKNDEVFFWTRRDEVTFEKVKKVFKNQDVKIHIHKPIDPEQKKLLPSKKDLEKFQMTFSDWFDTREEMYNCIKEKGIYIAPRVEEGIGMSFLEAMSMGKAIVANDKPTMNEYIKHGLTGYLCNMSRPSKIDFSNVEKIQKNTYEYMQKGYQKWLSERENIINTINAPFPNKGELNIRLICGMMMSCNMKNFFSFKTGRNAYLKVFGIELIKTKAI